MTAKSQKFRELAEKRANNAIEAILRIGKLSNHDVSLMTFRTSSTRFFASSFFIMLAR
jgi:hypothetical protein